MVLGWQNLLNVFYYNRFDFLPGIIDGVEFGMNTRFALIEII